MNESNRGKIVLLLASIYRQKAVVLELLVLVTERGDGSPDPGTVDILADEDGI